MHASGINLLYNYTTLLTEKIVNRDNDLPVFSTQNGYDHETVSEGMCLF